MIRSVTFHAGRAVVAWGVAGTIAYLATAVGGAVGPSPSSLTRSGTHAYPAFTPRALSGGSDMQGRGAAQGERTVDEEKAERQKRAEATAAEKKRQAEEKAKEKQRRAAAKDAAKKHGEEERADAKNRRAQEQADAETRAAEAKATAKAAAEKKKQQAQRDAAMVEPCTPEDSKSGIRNSYGEISIAQPKIWQSERVGALLDGLLRDIEGVSLADLTGLNPNTQNAAAVQFIQSAFDVGVAFDQASAVTNRANLRNADIQRQIQSGQVDTYRARSDADTTYQQVLLNRRAQLTAALFVERDSIAVLQPKHDAKTATADEETQLAAATSRAGVLTTELADVNTRLGQAGQPPTLTTPSIQNATVPQPIGTPTLAFGDFLKGLPTEVQSSLSTALKSPPNPPTKQLDNFITLLHERLAREVSALQDDLTRDPQRVAFLVQFDTSVYPSAGSTDRMARVEYMLKCADCQVYSLYPGMSSYNVANYKGVSRRRTIFGNLGTLIGLGITAAYRRQEDALQGSLVQSVYVSGFQHANRNGASVFGWYFNAAPFEQYVTPGIRSTFAIVTMPRSDRMTDSVPIVATGAWAPRDHPEERVSACQRTIALALPGIDATRPPAAVSAERDRLHVLRVEYNTVDHDPQSDTAPATDPLAACPENHCGAMLLTFDAPIDPNTVITVNGRPIQRVRDWRGRATSILPPAQSLSDGNGNGRPVAARSLTEIDQLQPDAWFATNSHDVLLNISRSLAGEDWFPVVVVSEPGRRPVVIPTDLDRGFSELLVNGYRMVPRTKAQVAAYASIRLAGVSKSTTAGGPDATTPLLIGPYPASTFAPLFAHRRQPASVTASLDPTATRLLVSLSIDDAKKFHFQPSRTFVILEDEDLDFAWSLPCAAHDSLLDCSLQATMSAIHDSYEQTVNECAASPANCRVEKSLNEMVARTRQALGQKTSPAPSQTSGDRQFIDSLQVWIEQFDPENKDAFYSAHPAPLRSFPLLAQPLGAGRIYEPWRLVMNTGQPPVLRECNAFPWPDRDLTLTRLSAIGDATNVGKANTSGCREIRLTDDEQKAGAVEWRLDSAAPGEFRVVSVQFASNRPAIKSVVTRPMHEQKEPFGVIGWTVDIETTNLPAGSVSIAPAVPDGVTVARSVDGVVSLGVSKRQLAQWPSSKLTLRVDGVAAVDVPQIRQLLLPSELKLQAVGTTQYALTGAQAGTLDAVSLVGGDAPITIRGSAATDLFSFDVTRRARAQSPAPLPPGTYSVLPLMVLDPAKGTYLPIDVRGANNTALTIVVPDPKKDGKPNPNRTVTTITRTVETGGGDAK